MKSCPICKARCFDDMDTCYGCMYQFSSLENEKTNAGTRQTTQIDAPIAVDYQTVFRDKPERPPSPSPSYLNSGESTNTIRLPLIQEGAKPEQEKLQAEYQLVISLEPVKQSLRTL